MNKRKTQILIIAVIIISTLLSLTAYAEGEKKIYDKLGYLSADESQALSAKLSALEKETGLSYYAVIYQSAGYSDKYIGDEFIREYHTGHRDCVVLIITLRYGEYYYDMYTYGDADSRISDKEVNYILDDLDVYNNIKSGNIVPGITEFFTLSGKAYSGRLGVSYSTISIVCFIIAIIISLIVCISVDRSYKKKLKSTKYPLDRYAKLELTHEDDVFVRSFVTTRRISNSSSGGSRTGGGSGHRGGR